MRDYKDFKANIDDQFDAFIIDCLKAVSWVVIGTSIIAILFMFMMFE